MNKSLRTTRRTSGKVNSSKVVSVYTQISKTSSVDEACEILSKARFSSDEGSLILASMTKGYLSSEVSLSVLVGVLTSFALLKEAARTHFLQEGGRMIQELVMGEEKSTTSLKALCLFFSSYHLRSYNVEEKTISSLLTLAQDFEQNEQKARLALNCIADYLMKIPEGVSLVLPQVLILLSDLSDPKRIVSGAGAKLNYSLLRSLYYCLVHSSGVLTPRDTLSVFLALKRFSSLKHSAEEYLNKAQGFAFQAIQALYKNYSRLLFPFLGVFVDSEFKEMAKESSNRDCNLLKTLTVFIENTPFSFFHLNNSDASEYCLFDLARRTVDLSFRRAIETLRTASDEDLLFSALKLVTVLLKVPLQLANFSKACEAIDLVRAKTTEPSVNLRKQSFGTLSSACLQYASFIISSFSSKTLSQLLADDELLPIKLGFFRDLSKKVEIPPGARGSALAYLYKYMTHRDYKVKNGVFETLGQFCKDPSVLRNVENQLNRYIETEDFEGIIPCLNMLLSISVDISNVQKTTESLFIILEHTQTPLLVGSMMKFLGFVFSRLSEDLKIKTIKKMRDLTKENVYLNDLTVALVSLTQNMNPKDLQNSFRLSLEDEIIEIASLLMKVPKTSSKSNLMGVFSNILQHSKLNLEHREAIYSHAKSLLDSSSSNTVQLASKVLQQLREHKDYVQNEGDLTHKLIELLNSTENYKSKISLVQVVQGLDFQEIGAIDTAIRELYHMLEHEKGTVVVDPYLQANQMAYKDELFIAVSNCLLKSPLRLVKGFLIEHMHSLVKTIYLMAQEKSQSVDTLSRTLLEWIDDCSDIPISFDCYENLKSMAEGSLDEVSISSEELDFEYLIR